jgi:hypothetical protein
VTTRPLLVVHGLADIATAASLGQPFDLISGPGAALYMGCAWWQEMLKQARSQWPGLIGIDILDCADDAARAIEAVSIGHQYLVLLAHSPAYKAVLAIADNAGAVVFENRTEALEVASWVRQQTRVQAGMSDARSSDDTTERPDDHHTRS